MVRPSRRGRNRALLAGESGTRTEDGANRSWSRGPYSPGGGSSVPADDTAVWMPLTTRVDGDLVLVADGPDGGLIPTLIPME